MNRHRSPPTLEIIVLAAGLGTRMKSRTPKVLHRICGVPMISLLLEELDRALASPVVPMRATVFNLVVGHGREEVMKEVEALRAAGRIRTPVVFTVQAEQLGTGHAVKLALSRDEGPEGERKALDLAPPSEIVAVFNGDLPLFRADGFLEFFDAHVQHESAASVGTAVLSDAGGYGRIIRAGAKRKFRSIVEFKDATPAQRAVREINGGVYLFERKLLSSALAKIRNSNAAGEFYLPDVFVHATKGKKRIHAHVFHDPVVLAGVNTMKELAEAQRELFRRTAERLMTEGTYLQEPGHTYVGPRVKVGHECVIGPFSSIIGNSTLADGVRIGSHCELSDVTVGESSVIRNGTVAEGSVIGRECAVGPMAHLRKGTRLGNNVRVGNFVETKEASIGDHTNAAHLSYIGDAEIGSQVNLGCGFITCNYDGVVREGKRKHGTVIGNGVFVGSDSQLVAPITIADGTYIASGSTVTESVNEKDSLVLARARQVTKPGYAKKYRKAKS